MLGKTQTGVFPISGFLVNQSLIKENCHNSRTSDDMKLGPVTKLNKRNKTTSKKLPLTSCRKIVKSLLVFGFLVNLEQSGGRIPDTESAKVMFSVKVTFFLTKTENRTKKSLTQRLTLLLGVKVLFWSKNATFLQKNADISKIRGA